MNDIFDMNLLTVIHGLDKKPSISKEQPGLKRKATNGNKHKSRNYNDTRVKKNIDNNNNERIISVEDGIDDAIIDLTV